MATTTAIEAIERHAKKCAGGKYKVKPGDPYTFSAAAEPGDGVAQGDCNIVLRDKVPAGYKKAAKPFVQLVPGNTEGARHCLDGLTGVEMYLPPNWPACAETELLGPVLVLTEERTILHPKHGNVTCPAGSTVEITYQPDYDFQLKAARRNAD